MYDQRVIGFCDFEVIIALQLPAFVLAFCRPKWHAQVGIADCLAHALQRDTLIKQRGRVQFYSHRWQRATTHANIADTWDLGDFLRHSVGVEIIELPLVVGVRSQCQCQDHDRSI